jgi:hypothetical protein
VDVVRLSEVLSWLRVEEANLKIQPKLEAVRDSLANLSSNPASVDCQSALSKSIADLEGALADFWKRYDPNQEKRIDEVGANPHFGRSLVVKLQKKIAGNPMSPAVVLQDVEKIVASRRNFMELVEKTEKGVDEFVNYDKGVKPGEAHIGFEIPRGIFDNEFKDFITELKTIHRIVRTFSELETGSVQEIKLGSISSTDPLIFLNTPPAVIASVAWIITQWKKLEEIRKLRAETAQINQFSEKELKDFFDKKITATINAEIKNRAEALLAESTLDTARRNELTSEVQWALRALFARVERGMRVEVETQLLPTEKEAKTDDSGEKADVNATNEVLSEVDRISTELKFPISRGKPVLELTQANADGGGETKDANIVN